jgi:hypothetical protein
MLHFASQHSALSAIGLLVTLVIVFKFARRPIKRSYYNGRMGNSTFPAWPLTGDEKTVAELSQLDERGFCDVEHLQAPFLHAERGLPAAVPEKVRQRIIVARQLAVYGYFCYEFNAVSLFWSVSCIEMALKQKFWELNPGPFQLIRRRRTCEVPFVLLEQHLHQHWRISDMAYFDYSFRALLTWAFRSEALPDDLPIRDRLLEKGLISPNSTSGEIQKCWSGLSEEQMQNCGYKLSGLIEKLPNRRNDMAHPEFYNLVVPPSSPLDMYRLVVDIVGRLWPNVSDSENRSA